MSCNKHFVFEKHKKAFFLIKEKHYKLKKIISFGVNIPSIYSKSKKERKIMKVKTFSSFVELHELRNVAD